MLDARRVLWGAMLLGLWVRAGHAVEAQVTLGGKPATVSASACGFSVAYLPGGPQVAVTNQYIVMSLRKGEEATIILPVEGVADNSSIMATASLIEGRAAEVSLSPEGGPASRAVLAEGHTSVELRGKGAATVRLVTRATRGAASVRWRKIRLGKGADSRAISVKLSSPVLGAGPPPALPLLHPEIENALIEWDWRMQDGIGTPRAPSTYDAATQRIVQSIDGLIRARQADGVDVAREKTWLDAVRWVSKEGGDAETAWRIMHTLRRRLVLRNPLLTDLGPLLFVKQVPGCFSHQLTQYYGRYARPGGGLFVLEKPGQSMACRQLAPGALPEGSVMHPEVSTDGRRILFAYCQAETTPRDPIRGHAGRYYHLYEVAGEGVRRLTDGDFDDFSPKILPNGKIVFVSTRRLGWHRCGSPGCENYTLAMANADGSNPHPISFHETQEWDPAVLNDGRIIYTRWDYVDRHAVYYEQLWTVRADGSAPVAFYGNNTFNPVGTWEARPVPGSRRVMATAAAHHAMTAGSIVLIDVAKGVDGLEPITRLTPDVPFPESEAPVLPRWRATAGNPRYPTPIEAQRWPGHCYRSPYPLSETCFLVAYSYDALICEPKGNPANMFGVYLVDGLGNRELLYRDPNIASLWPIPLRPRPRPFDMAPATEHIEAGDGVFLLQDVYASEPRLARGSVKRLRIVQV
ncbi:PD40 domain-containing protein, partial [bacterium]|nr:PD40 domain-containing protein [bacterium]